jgi:4-hydroxy-2-oxoheptanedioate aldolase
MVTLGRVGAWCSIGNSYAVEVLASCGFDWICIDLQHGFASPGDLLPMLQAAAITGVPALVRVPRLDTGLIGRALDAGAAGVIIPMVNSAAQAREAVRACRYPPDGVRSWGPARLMLAEPGYSAEAANARVQCLVMVETLEAVRNLDEIVRVPGVDAVFVGPSDLAVDMGLPPRRGAIAGEHAAALASIARTCQDSGVPAGIFCGTFPAVTEYGDLGYTILAAVTDAALIRAGATEGLRTLRTPSPSSALTGAEPPGPNPADESETP